MAQRTIRFAPRAEADLESIVVYIQERSGRANSARVLARILQRIDNLALFPRTGRVERRFKGAPRVAVIRPWLVLYEDQPAANAIVIRRIVDGRRDLTTMIGASR